MKRLEQGKDGFAFMSWEQNPMKRDVNNIVKFNVNNYVEITVGYILQGDRGKERVSEYEVTEVIDIRPSSMKGKNYVTVKTIHSYKPLSQ